MTFLLQVHQTAPRRGDVEHNLREMEHRLGGDRGPGISVFPELSLTGYDLGSGARGLALPSAAPPPVGPVATEETTVVFGYPELAEDGRLYNTAGVVAGRGWIHRYRKRYLPTYGMFDEGRIFAPGTAGPRIFHPSPAWPTAILVCEDFWHPSLSYLAALRGAVLLLVLAAAPGRESPEHPEEDGPRFRSHGAWRLLARSTALTHGLYVALVNRAGVEEGVTFAGGSLVVAPDGTVLAEGSHQGEDRLEVALDREAVHRARNPYAHIRDESPELVLRELQQILGEEGDTGHSPRIPDGGE